jgi:Fibronectin type III domain/Divergent InlB B-repeat domain
MNALVTLQVAPRGPGRVSAAPPATNDPNPCTANQFEASCEWQFERGATVELTAKPDEETPGRPGKKSFAGWSDPDCGAATKCVVKLEDETTSIVATFSPLRLGVKFSDSPGGATVQSTPSGQPCGDDEQLSDGVFCAKFAAHERVQLRVVPGSTVFQGWNEGGDYLCEPTNSTSCTIAVDDEPTWAGARFADDSPPQLPTTIKVQFKVRKGGDGGGRVTAASIDCGTVCSASFGFGKKITLTASRDDGSYFGGWSGVCAATQTSCSFAAGPITSVRAVFRRDTTAPSAPGAPRVTSRTRTVIAVAWTPSTDNVGVTGYRVYRNGVPAGETKDTRYRLERLKCGTTYAIAVDAVDLNGNRSPRAVKREKTKPCALVARLVGVAVRRAGPNRVVDARLRVNRATTAHVRLLRGRRAVQGRLFRVKSGTNRLRMRLARRTLGGRYLVAIWLINPDGGRLVVPSRSVVVPRP